MRRLKRAFMTCIGSLARYARILSYSKARLSCPFLEARGNLEDASTTLSAHSRAMTVKTWNGLYRMSRLGLIAAIPGKGLTNGLLLRRAAECVTVTREDECLTSNKAYSFFPLPRARGDTRNAVSLHVKAHREKKWIYTRAN